MIEKFRNGSGRFGRSIVAFGIVAALGVSAVGWAAGQMNGGYPDPQRRHYEQVNCHGAYDLLVAKDEAGEGFTSDEQDFASLYEANSEAGQPCPAPPESLAAQAVNRDLISPATMYRVELYGEQGDRTALYELARAHIYQRFPESNASDGVAFLQEAARLGDPAGQFLLGMVRMQESAIGPKDEAAAVRHFEAAAAQDHVDALHLLGIIHSQGLGVRQDPKKGLDYLKRAAELGHVHATFTAANMVNLGQGVRKDYDLAYRLARNLVDQGEAIGAGIAASALLQRRDVKKHQDEILYWMDFASRHGDEKIQSDMARFRPQVVDVFNRMNAPPEYRPRERRICPQKRVCTVYVGTGVERCHTVTDYWNDCNAAR